MITHILPYTPGDEYQCYFTPEQMCLINWKGIILHWNNIRELCDGSLGSQMGEALRICSSLTIKSSG